MLPSQNMPLYLLFVTGCLLIGVFCLFSDVNKVILKIKMRLFEVIRYLYFYWNRCILAGDHLQLPPTIVSKKAARDRLEVTLLERVVSGVGEKAVKMLTMQYR